VDFGVCVGLIRGWCWKFRTLQGYVGLGHAQAKVGDTVCLLSGCSVPVILRLCDGGYKVVVEAYVHGIMDGEAWEFGDSKLEETFISC
jgi:hypothetical protein